MNLAELRRYVQLLNVLIDEQYECANTAEDTQDNVGMAAHLALSAQLWKLRFDAERQIESSEALDEIIKDGGDGAA